MHELRGLGFGCIWKIFRTYGKILAAPLNVKLCFPLQHVGKIAGPKLSTKNHMTVSPAHPIEMSIDGCQV